MQVIHFKVFILVNFLILFLSVNISHASDISNPIPLGKYLLAQETSDDSYDPFSDFAEFEEDTDEEKDINFFKNGRFLTVGFLFGIRGFTDTMSEKYSISSTYGFMLNYFFDLRFALQFGYINSDHGLTLKSETATNGEYVNMKGTTSFNLLQVNLKYFFNTDIVTKGLAELNPFLIGGFSSVTRTISVASLEGYGVDKATSIDIGGGIEIPILRNKMFIGAQFQHHLITFKDEGTNIKIDNVTFGTMSGDSWDTILILGTNF